VDASAVVSIIHQNHDYSHHPKGKAGVKLGEEAMRNRKLIGAKRTYTVHDATHKLTLEGIEWNAAHLFAPSKRALVRWWVALVRPTLPVFHRLGIRKDRLARLANLIGASRIRKK
jgi:hypothetical protein